MSLQQSLLENRFLARLSASDFARLAADLVPVTFALSEVLVEPDEIMSHVVFLETGIASIVVLTGEGGSVEGGMVGREGFVAPSVGLGIERIPHRIEMQLQGSGHRIERTALLAAAAASEALRNALLAFANTMMVQSAYTVLSNATQTVEARLARWLLMVHDRSSSDDLPLTHRFLAVMLAVRRPSVTEAMHGLEERGLIQAERGYITVRNRPGLEAFADIAYGKAEDEYRRLLGPL